jgi:hypothetical protein
MSLIDLQKEFKEARNEYYDLTKQIAQEEGLITKKELTDISLRIENDPFRFVLSRKNKFDQVYTFTITDPENKVMMEKLYYGVATKLIDAMKYLLESDRKNLIKKLDTLTDEIVKERTSLQTK